MNNRQYLWLMVIVVVIACGVSSLGTLAAVKALPPQVINVPAPYPVYQTVNNTVYVDRYVDLWHEPEVIVETVNNTVIKEVEVEKVRWIVPQPFEDKEEMLKFLDYYRENRSFIFTVEEDGKADFDKIENNCVDMAEDLKRMATEKGYDFDTEVLSIREMTALYKKYFDRPHMINKAILLNGDCWYYDFDTNKLWQAW